MEGRLRVQVQVELAGADAARLWVAVEGSSSIRDVAAAVSAQFAKVRGHPVAVSELTLRGALLDPDEKVGFWVADQELLYAVASPLPVGAPAPKSALSAAAPAPAAPLTAPPATASSAKQDGVLVSHEVPLHQVMKLQELAPQSMTLVVLGADGVGKAALIGSFVAGHGAAGVGAGAPQAPPVTDGATLEKIIEVDGVAHNVVVVDAEYAHVEDSSRNYFGMAHGFLFVFDVSSRTSFDALKDRLLGLMVASRGHDPAVPVTIVSSVRSSDSKRVVTARETLALAQELSTLVKGSVALYEVGAHSANALDAFQDTFLNILHWRSCEAKNANQAGWCVTM